MAFRNIRDVLAAWEEGRCWNSFFYKVATPTINGGRWGDMAMGAGTPVYQPYVGNAQEATPIIGQKNQGINTGPQPAAGMEKYLAGWSFMTPSTLGLPYPIYLCDYLMFYPLIDGDSTDEQVLDNTATLPRYTDGEGVQAMLVCTVPVPSDATIQIRFTDSDGVERTTTQRIWNSTVSGDLLNLDSSNGVTANINSFPFINIGGARGIRSINAVTLLTAPGGLFAIVLVKPITQMLIREGLCVTERCLISQFTSLPKIEPGAYLNLLLFTNVNSNPGNIRGQLDFIWG